MKYISCLLLLTACVGTSGKMPGPLAEAPVVDLRPDLGSPSLRSMAASIGVLPRTEGLARAIYGMTSCNPPLGVNPCVYLPRTVPRAGRLLTAWFATRCGGNAPSELCWLIVSFRRMPRPVDFTQYGMPQCWLLVNPDSLVAVPKERAKGAMVWRDEGLVTFEWLPPESAAGLQLFAQLLVASSEGWLVSPGLELIIGSP